MLFVGFLSLKTLFHIGRSIGLCVSHISLSFKLDQLPMLHHQLLQVSPISGYIHTYNRRLFGEDYHAISKRICGS
ncbi:uncharacterized protein BDZ83DRAFT_624170 [Colletotrichum acutatum]|uniref:Uncharacterized protein n=1 Tax=Glomerella acutata TaxID=27357 RepID=A0AAD8UIX3_GLOAC|nr:uncharacterized protein BDZ83DRAFT_624170 [Colletotrichum acutatum]KAK1724098.1 hypothetical protein BDZ83DRAFT_624170 [Colletotrichum acutatum]